MDWMEKKWKKNANPNNMHETKRLHECMYAWQYQQEPPTKISICGNLSLPFCTLPFEKYQLTVFSLQTIFKKDQLSTVLTIYTTQSSQQIGLLHKSYSYLPSWKRRQLVRLTPDNQSKLLPQLHTSQPTTHTHAV
jgi:hypothetical protein